MVVVTVQFWMFTVKDQLSIIQECPGIKMGFPHRQIDGCGKFALK